MTETDTAADRLTAVIHAALEARRECIHISPYRGEWPCEDIVARILATDPDMVRALALGLSWDRLGPDGVARLFHESYEALAPDHGYETRRDSALPWEDVPERNRLLMRATAKRVGERLERLEAS